MKRRYAPIIDIVRFVAAIMVALYHFCTTWPDTVRDTLIDVGYPFSGQLDGLLYFGFVGVEIFFVISGYVIAASCVGRSPRDFLIGRAMRLLPMLWLSVGIGFVTLAAFRGGADVELVQRALTSATISPFSTPLDVVIWTLTIEAIFYAVVWLLLLVSENRIEECLIGFAKLIAVLSLSNLLLEQAGYRYSDLIPNLLLLRHGAFFAVGILIWAYGSRQRPFDVFALIALAACLVEIFSLVSAKNALAGTAYTFLLPAAVWLLGVGAILHGATHLVPSVSRRVRLAGLMTYPIYLIHNTVGGAIIALAHNRFGVPMALAIPLGVVAVLIVSAALVELVEPRLRPAFLRGFHLIVPGRRKIAAVG